MALGYNDVIMGAMASQITGVSVVYLTVYSGSKKTSKLRVTALCAGNSPVTGEFPAQRACNADYVSIWWRPYGLLTVVGLLWLTHFDTWGPDQDVQHFPDGIFKLFHFESNFAGLFSVCNKSAVVRVMAWCQTGKTEVGYSVQVL